jgi:4-nitrophenyl phosphatase
VLPDLRGLVFDLDGCVWQGSVLEPGAREALTALHASGRALGFLSNNSRASGRDLRRRLHEHGIAVAQHVLTPLDIMGAFIGDRFGRSHVLVMGAPELVEAVRRGGHTILDFEAYRKASVVVVGNDFDVSYARLTAAARAVAAGAPLVTPNLDPRLPVEGGDFLPGCAAFVEAVAVVAGVRPVVVGKPDPPLFHMAMRQMGVGPEVTAMVGDSPAADIRGGRAAGMRTILYAPGGPADHGEADVIVRAFDELLAVVGVARPSPGGVT